jgi:CcmD family protein
MRRFGATIPRVTAVIPPLTAVIPRLKAGALGVAIVLLVASGAQAQPQPPKDFVPVDETLPGEQIPALPLIAGAYGFIWVGLLGYLWIIGKRLQKVEAELGELESRRK